MTLLNELKNDKGVNQVAYTQGSSFFVTVPSDEVSKDFLDYYAKTENLSVSQIEDVGIYTNFKFVDDEAYRALLRSYKLNEKNISIRMLLKRL